MIGAPIAIVGLLVCATVIALPIGLPIVVLSGVPLGRVIKRKIKWDVRDVPLGDDYDIEGTLITKPWEV